ncbi:MAG: hypothetical protein ACK44W_05750 [Planctomycetota bacterium]
MSAPLVLRVSGWIVSLSGAALLVFSGGFGQDAKNPLPWIGAIVMVVGMILTSSSGLVAHLAYMKRLRRRENIPPDGP